MSVRETLPHILRGDEAARLTPEAFARLDALAHEADAEMQLVFVRDECAARMRQGGASNGVEYLLSQVCRLHRENERAHQTLLALGDKLAAAKEWEALAVVAESALAVEETGAAAHLLVSAHEALKRDPERIEALQRAWAIIPDDLELGLTLAVRLGELGRGGERRALLGALMPQFAAEKRYAGVEEAALEFTEHEDYDGLIQLIQTLPSIVEQDAQAEVDPAARHRDAAARSRAGRAGDVIEPVRKVVLKTLDKLGPAAADKHRPCSSNACARVQGAICRSPTR